MSKDIGNYLDDISFETEVYPGVYWIPLNALGKTRYTNEQMMDVVQMSFEQKKAAISNLYEAVQLFQLSEFKGVMDNADHWVDSIHWQTHKNQEQAVFSNEGCCATDTNWLAFFIKDHYDFVCSFCYANQDGNGHITTCIQQDAQYYFIDMMMCRKDSQNYFCKETGIVTDFMDTEWAGYLYKCRNPVDFCRFNIERFQSKNRSVPFCFYMRKTDCVTATGCSVDSEKTIFFVPESDHPLVIYGGEGKNKLQEVKLPESIKRAFVMDGRS